MPLVYRAMAKDADGLPLVEQSARGLGVRPGNDVDVFDGEVAANGKGMSVAPSLHTLPVFRVPKRLQDKVPGARGSNGTYCFRMGHGPFEAGAFAEGLELVPDSPTHGCIAPSTRVPLEEYEGDLVATRSEWSIDES